MKRIVCSVVLIACAMTMADDSVQTTRQPNDEPARATLQPGDVMPDIVFYDMSNKPVHLPAEPSRRMLICTWASW